jgi:hypothetical protein
MQKAYPSPPPTLLLSLLTLRQQYREAKWMTEKLDADY